MGRDGEETSGDDEWKYAVGDVGAETDESDDDESALAGVFGLRRAESETVERESVDIENALFVLLGVALTLFAIWQAIP
ncbi:MAG: hypothetical protein ABEJ86_05255 [Halococcoides sp.]